MKIKTLKITSGFIWGLTLLMSASALAQVPGSSDYGKLPSTFIPIHRTAQPANDLIYDGKNLDPGRGLDLAKKGVDLSQLNPRATDLWSDSKKTLRSEALQDFPNETATVNFEEFIDRFDDATETDVVVPGGKTGTVIRTKGLLRSQVSDAQGNFFRLSVSLEHHSALMRAALMRYLGYNAQSPRYYRELRVQFANVAARKKFLDAISETTLSDAEKRGWVKSAPADASFLVLQDVILENARLEVSPYHWGRISSSHVKGRRILRALVVPFVLVDIPQTQNVNIFSWQAASVLSEHLVMYNMSAGAFGDTSIEDVKWILRRMAFLTRADWQQIVSESQYPADIQALILEKVIARRNNMLLVTGVTKDLPSDMRELSVNTGITVGSVVKGKATQEKYDGYASRFTFGDPESPLTRTEILKWLKIEGLGIAINQFIKIINERMIVQQVSDLASVREEQKWTKFFQHMFENPGVPYVQEVGTWGGPIGTFVLNASRNLISGTFYGSESNQVQLVDQITLGGSAGYFIGVDGLNTFVPSVTGNLQALRTYVHVRPVLSISAAEKESWKKLWVPHFMLQLGMILDSEGKLHDTEKEIEKLKESHKKFLDELAEGELMSITDSIAVGVRGAVTIPVTALMGFDITFSNSFSLGITNQMMMYRRVTFSRENGLLKVYISTVNAGSMGVALDAYFWMSIASLSRDFKHGQAHTRAYHIPEKYETDDQLKKDVRAIRSVLLAEDTSLVEEQYKPFVLNHDLNIDTIKGKFLFWRWNWYDESHVVKVQPPIPDGQNLNPKDYERTLASHRWVRRSGRNYYSFLSDIIDGAIGYTKVEWLQPGFLSTKSGDDPSASFLGTAKTYSIQTEDEITPGKPTAPITISKTSWTGWIMSKNQLFSVLDQIEARINDLPKLGPLTSITLSHKLGEQVKTLKGDLFLIDRNVFNDMRQLQFYEITSRWMIRSAGLKKLVGLVMDNKGPRPSTWDRIGGKDAYTNSDQNVLNGLVQLMGGDEVFQKACHVQVLKRRSETATFPPNLLYGKEYSCVLKWMHPIFEGRRSWESLSPRGRVEWLNQMVRLLEENIPLQHLMAYFGTENFFLQVLVSGFRVGDELMGDSTFKGEAYVSSSLGTIGKGGSTGVFTDFSDETKISQQEIFARYLGEGY